MLAGVGHDFEQLTGVVLQAVVGEEFELSTQKKPLAARLDMLRRMFSVRKECSQILEAFY